MMTATSAGLATLWDGRGLPRLAVAAGVAAGVSALMLILAWFAGRPRRIRARR